MSKRIFIDGQELDGFENRYIGDNLLDGTSDAWQKFPKESWDSGRVIVSTSKTRQISMRYTHSNEVYVYSAWVSNKTDAPLKLEIKSLDVNKHEVRTSWSRLLQPGYTENLSCEEAITPNTYYLQSSVISDANNATTGEVWIASEGLYHVSEQPAWHKSMKDILSAVTQLQDRVSKLENQNGGVNSLLTAFYPPMMEVA